PDEDSNGFVDNPYSIDGDAGNEDLLPLAEIGVVPEIPDETPIQTPLVLDPLILGGVAAMVSIAIIFVVIRKRVS
ncbi:MAG: hypothetical protein ACFFEE_11275, partial [Candidatus Thorarchaeota archaeon]